MTLELVLKFLFNAESKVVKVWKDTTYVTLDVTREVESLNNNCERRQV